jgi:hypothetical protein
MSSALPTTDPVLLHLRSKDLARRLGKQTKAPSLQMISEILALLQDVDLYFVEQEIQEMSSPKPPSPPSSSKVALIRGEGHTPPRRSVHGHT